MLAGLEAVVLSMRLSFTQIRLVSVLTLCLGTAVSFGQSVSSVLAEARAEIDARQFSQSEKTLRTYLLANPADPDVHFLLGFVLFRERKPTDSLAEFTAGAKYREPSADDFKVVASDYVLLSDLADADKWFSRAVAEKPDDSEGWYLLGRTKFNENIYAEAIADFGHVLTLHPNDVEAENNIGLAWKELNELSKAQSAFEQAIAWQGQAANDAQPFLNLGMLFMDLSQNDKALDLLIRAEAIAPDNPSIHEQLGKIYAAQQKLAESQAQFERAIALAPEASSLHFKLAQVLRKEGKTERAQEEFALCEKLNSVHSSTKTPNPPSAKPGTPR